jgi:pimeloyl-ACP methyl ester carboxylesterase
MNSIRAPIFRFALSLQRHAYALALFFLLVAPVIGACSDQRPTLAPVRSSLALPTSDQSSPSASQRLSATLTRIPSLAPSGTPTLTPSPSRTRTATFAAPSPTDTRRPTSTPSSTPASPTRTAQPPPLSSPPIAAVFDTHDGIRLAGSLYLPPGEGPFPGVLLSHMGGADRDAWGEVPALLQEEGYATLTFDFRGHGQSEGKLDPPSAATDVETALTFLRTHPQVNAERVALVGASMGGLASVIVAASDADVDTVVVVSTSPDAAGQNAGEVVGRISPRSFLAFGCDNDPLTELERVRQLHAAAGPPKQLIILECAAHANDILNTAAAPVFLAKLLSWLRFYIGPSL